MNKKLFCSILAAAAAIISGYAQTCRSMVIEDGGTGPYKSVIVSDETLPAFTIYRPQDLNEGGSFPVILYGNGACMNSSIEIRYFLNELASHGYIAVAIGPYNEDDFFAHWTSVMKMMHPSKKDVVLADGTVVRPVTKEELEARRLAEEKQQKENTSDGSGTAGEAPFRTYPRQLLEALDWLTDRNADSRSDYYHKIDLENVAVMGQSCGGAQALAVSHDPRIKTTIILNSGIGDMEMMGCSKENLASVHAPMMYIVGGPEDMATRNAAMDFKRLNDVPVVLIDTAIDGHEGSYYEAHGGKYAVAVRKWLDWQLKKKTAGAALFLDDEYFQISFPGWSIIRKNID